MSQTMRVIASAGGYEVTCDMNGVISISKDKALYICDSGSAYEMIRTIPDKEARIHLLKQWETDKVTQGNAEDRSRGAEFHG